LTFPKRLEDISAYGHFHSENGALRYGEDLFVVSIDSFWGVDVVLNLLLGIQALPSQRHQTAILVRVGNSVSSERNLAD
jgi:hypothetical protein